MKNKNISEGSPSSPKHYAQSVFISSLGSVFTLGCNIITVAYAARALTKSELGAFFLFVVVGNLLVVFGEFGLRTALVKFLSEAEQSEKRLLANEFMTIRACSMLAMLIILPGVIFFLNHLWAKNESFLIISWWLIVYVQLHLVFQAGNGLLVGLNHLRFYSLIAVIHNMSRMVFIISCIEIWGFKGSVWGIMITMTILNLLIWNKLPHRFEFSRHSMQRKKIISYSRRVYGVSLLSQCTSKSADIIIASFLSSAAVAVYGSAIKIPNVIGRIFDAVRPIILNLISVQHKSLNNAAMDNFSNTAVRIFTIMFALGGVFLVTFGEYIILMVFSHKYSECIPLFRVLTIWSVISITQHFLTVTMLGTDKERFVLQLALLQLVITIIAHFYLIAAYGVFGATYSVLLVASLSILYSLFHLANTKSQFVKLLEIVGKSFIPFFIVCFIVGKYGDSWPTILICFFFFSSFQILTKNITLDELRFFLGRLI